MKKAKLIYKTELVKTEVFVVRRYVEGYSPSINLFATFAEAHRCPIYNYLLNFNGLCPINHKWLMIYALLYRFLFHSKVSFSKERKEVRRM